MLKPLIKYTGGKYSEYKKIKEYFPSNFKNYYEPFVGGGGVLFRLHNENKLKGNAYINDFSKTLIDFYKNVQSEELNKWLNLISASWSCIDDFADYFSETYQIDFKDYICGVTDKLFTEYEYIIKDVKDIEESISINLHDFSLSKKILDGLRDKANRFKKKELTDDEIDEVTVNCITTSIHQSFYFIIRDMYNDWNNHNNSDKYEECEKIAQWVFIREYCFGSMFRFSSNGDFNIPYGGNSYNGKCFQCKVDVITSKETYDMFSNVNVTCGDFEEAIDKWKPTEDDFMFLDPPYDSTFSEYDNNSFGKEEHKRLAECLKKCKCKWLMAIGKTDFIQDLYKGFNVVEYDKTYMYQARGEYSNKHTSHLVITNYPILKENRLW